MKLLVWTADPPDQHLAAIRAMGAASGADGATVTVRRLSPAGDSLPAPGTAGDEIGQIVPGAPTPAGLLTIQQAPDAAALSPALSGMIRERITGVRVLAVREHLAMAPSPETALSRVGLVTRKYSLTLGAFWQHWTQIHIPLVLAHDPLFDGYATNLLDDRALPWSGVVEQWFVNTATWTEHDRRLREERAAIVEDIRKFISRVVQFEAVQVATMHI